MFPPPWEGDAKYSMLDATGHFFIAEDLVLADLRSSDEQLKRQACVAISRWPMKAYDQALPELVRLLNAADHDSVMAAVPALGTPDAVSEFESIAPRFVELYEKSEVADERSTLAKAICAVCSDPTPERLPAALAMLTKLLDDADGLVSKTAAMVLGDFGDSAVPAIPALVRQVRLGGEWNWRLEGAATALGKIGHRPELCVPALVGALKELHGSSEPWSMTEVIAATGCFGLDAEAAVPQLRAMLTDESLYLELIVAVLLKIDPSPVESLERAYPVMPIREGSERYFWTSPKLRVLLELRHRSGLEHADKLRDFHGQTSLVLPVNATDEDVKFLTALNETVRTVTQERPDDLTTTPPRITDIGLAYLTRFSGIESLNLFNGAFSDAGIGQLAKLDRLESLKLGDDSRVLMSRLNLPLVTDVGLRSLNGLRGLKRLSLHLTNVDGTGVQHLRGPSQLQILDLSHSGVTDAGVAAVVEAWPGLRTLNLNWTNVTADAVDDLLRLRKLRWLGVYNSDLNGPYPSHSEATKRLERELPNCEIMWID